MKKPSTTGIVVIIIILIGVSAQFASDNYLPSMPAITAYFKTNAEYIKLSMTIYLFGLGISQLIYGPLADVFGRKVILLIGFVIFILASLLAAMATHLHFFLYARLLQGIGMGSAIALYRSILRDVTYGENFAVLASYVMVIVALTPPLAPITGGYIQQYLGWRYNFILVMALAFIVSLLILILFPETLPKDQRQSFSIANIMQTYKHLLFDNKKFMLNAISSSMVMSSVIIYVVVTAFLYQKTLGLTPIQYGWLTIFNAAMMMLGGIINAKLVNKLGLNNMINLGIGVMIIGAALILTFALDHLLNVWVILLPMLLIFISTSIIFINLMTSAFDSVHASIGTASALYGSTQVTAMAVVTILAAYIPDYTQTPLALLLLFIPLATAALRYLSF